MAETVVGATIEILLEKMLTLSAELIGLVRHFKDDLKKLQETISLVKAFLHDAEEKRVTADAVKIWLRDLQDLAFEADNVIDEVNYRLLSKKVGAATRSKLLKKKVLNHRIKDINERLESIHQHARNLGLQSIAAQQAPAVYASETTQTVSFSEDLIFHGRKEELSSVVGTLLITSTEPKLSVLPIVGMGGLGKTTFVRKVFNHVQIKSHFGDRQRVWVHVPVIFDEVVLLEKILTSMETGCAIPHGNREALLKKLQKHLGVKKYLLVLDDVWNEDRKKWDGFVNSLSGISSAAGNCIIVTTRKHEAASIVNTLPVHELKCLSEDDCWSIIKAKAFTGAGDDPSEFKAIGINIAEKCRGSPLAAKVVGGLLRGKSKDEWMSIEKNWISDYGDDQNPMPRVLKLSFDNLSSPSLKKCFAYCSIFPKGYVIKKEQMVKLWMAEGFLQTDLHIDMETTGDKLFNILLQKSLLQVVRSDDYGSVTHCNMHDLVHDLAFSILHENDNITDGVCQGRYIGYKSNGDGLLSIAKGQERYVRTLFFNGKISEIKFSDFESLRTLILLSGEDIVHLPTSIRKLKHLRYLDISKTRIKILPNSIGELYHLQTLSAKVYLVKLPDSLSCLVSLRHLHVSINTKLSPKIGKLNSLQALRYFRVGRGNGYRISELGSLKNLKGNLTIFNLEEVRDKNEAMCADLHGKAGIYELQLEWDSDRVGDEANDESVLEGLQPHHNLRKLELREFRGKTLALWEGINNLVEIILAGCGELECLPDWVFSNNHNLTKLEICGCPKITHLVPHLGGGGAPSLLRDLRIWDCPSFRELPNDLHTLSSLEVLEIFGCPDLKSIPYPISSGGGGGQQQQQEGLTSLRELKIYYCEGLTNLPIEMVESCAKSLKYLGLRNLNFRIGCLHIMTHLRHLEIREVPKFSSTDIIGSPLSLEYLDIGPFSDCNNVSFNEAVGAILLPQLVGSLRHLELHGKEDWDRLPDQLQHLTSLKSLTLHDFEMQTLPEWFGNLSFLKGLALYGKMHWDSLPDQLQHLTSLERLWLQDFGIEALPEWFGNLSSLETLRLSFCKKLRHLPSKQCLSKLTYLDIYDCPLLLKEENRSNNNNNNNILERRCPQIADSEWPKISHIPTVDVDFVRISSEE